MTNQTNTSGGASVGGNVDTNEFVGSDGLSATLTPYTTHRDFDFMGPFIPYEDRSENYLEEAFSVTKVML